METPRSTCPLTWSRDGAWRQRRCRPPTGWSLLHSCHLWCVGSRCLWYFGRMIPKYGTSILPLYYYYESTTFWDLDMIRICMWCLNLQLYDKQMYFYRNEKRKLKKNRYANKVFRRSSNDLSVHYCLYKCFNKCLCSWAWSNICLVVRNNRKNLGNERTC